MEGESSKPASAPTGAVFLSYASEDAEAAQKICEALRAAGIEVFLDQSELRGGDVWDERIRREIHDCALFIPVISANTASRREGYFRLEWDLADQRSHMMAPSRVFVVPVCLDATTEAAADVPESFRRAQWTRLPAGETPSAFVERIRRLLSPEASAVTRPPASTMSDAVGPVGEPIRASRWVKALVAIVALVVFASLAYFVADKFLVSKHPASPPASSTGFAPPPHSIAVLPFVNLSGDKEQEYFSDGLTEELLNSLAEIEGLQVAARTSSFSFKEHPDIITVAHKLNVGAVLEGSVRRSEHTVRVTAQLINAVTGFHLWSKTYDRDLGDVLKLQTEIATAVASALKVTLLGDVSTKIELGGTRNPAAFDAYLLASKASTAVYDGKDSQTTIAKYSDAIRLDPQFALAFAGRSRAFSFYANVFANGAAVREAFDKAQVDAREAIKLAPDLAEGHLALANFLQSGSLNFAQASEEYERALALAPGNAQVLDNYGRYTAMMGRSNAGIAAVRRAVTLDPLNPTIHRHLGFALSYARRYGESLAAFQEALALDPHSTLNQANVGVGHYMLGDFQRARSSCEGPDQDVLIYECLALAYHKLGRHADAEATLAKCQADAGDSAAYQYAEIYAQWGNLAKALEWLGTALRLRDPGLSGLKTDPLMDPMREESRFQAVERELKFPE